MIESTGIEDIEGECHGHHATAVAKAVLKPQVEGESYTYLNIYIHIYIYTPTYIYNSI